MVYILSCSEIKIEKRRVDLYSWSHKPEYAHYFSGNAMITKATSPGILDNNTMCKWLTPDR
jgi:hypothetical protein